MGYFSELSNQQRTESVDNETQDIGTELLEKAEEINDTQSNSNPESTKTANKEKEADEEDKKRKEHEAAEAKRKAEWEAKKKEKEEKELLAWESAIAVDDDTLMKTAIKRVGDEAERLTRRNMKECITEMLQASCFEDVTLAMQIHHPRKNMVNCFRYVTRKAKEFVLQEMKDNDIKPDREGYGSDVPDDLCYQWAKEYFFDMEAPEDKDPNEEKFVPRPYTGKTATTPKKKTEKKKVEPKKEEAPKPKATSPEGQMDLFSMLGGDVAA